MWGAAGAATYLEFAPHIAPPDAPLGPTLISAVFRWWLVVKELVCGNVRRKGFELALCAVVSLTVRRWAVSSG